jgi:enoyl-CoA hydratase/carnithine racemase
VSWRISSSFRRIGYLDKSNCNTYYVTMAATIATSALTRIDAGTEQLDVSVHSGIAMVVLNNPSRRNALSRAMVQALPRVLDQLAENPAVRVVVFRGAGGRAFAAGVDITDFADPGGRSVVATFEAEYAAMLDRVRRHGQATIAMIEGACVGGGVELALACDLRFAAEGSTFAIPAARLGLGYVDVEPLVAAIGGARAAEMLFTARPFDVGELAASGLVNRVVPSPELDDLVHETAAAIARNAPLALAASKLALRTLARGRAVPDDPTVRAAVAVCYASEDFAEGQRAFLEKRAPRFTGR